MKRALLPSLAILALLLPLLHLLFPAGHPLHLPEFYVQLLGKFLCYATCALAIDLIWGFTGILSLGHGLFFALGGYGMGMYLMRQIGREGQYQSDLPDFMVFLNWKELPWHWALLRQPRSRMLFLAVAVPGLVAFVFGYFAFQQPHPGRVLFHHHAGAHRGRHAAVLPQ